MIRFGLRLPHRRIDGTKKDQILHLLKARKVVSNFELERRVCFSYAQRVYDLRNEGHLIHSQHIKGSRWEFRYLGYIAPKEHV